MFPQGIDFAYWDLRSEDVGPARDFLLSLVDTVAVSLKGHIAADLITDDLLRSLSMNGLREFTVRSQQQSAHDDEWEEEDVANQSWPTARVDFSDLQRIPTLGASVWEFLLRDDPQHSTRLELVVANVSDSFLEQIVQVSSVRIGCIQN